MLTLRRVSAVAVISLLLLSTSLNRDTYRFLIESNSGSWEGGLIDFRQEAVPIPPGSEIRMPAAVQVQIGLVLFRQRLKKYTVADIPESCRLKDFRINSNNINLIDGSFSPLTYQIKYDVLPVRPDSDWVSGGVSGERSWITDKVIYMKVVADQGQFKIMGLSKRPPTQNSSNHYRPTTTVDDPNPNLTVVASKLIRDYLEHYRSPAISESERLRWYKVNEIKITSQSNEGFNFFVDYTVQGSSPDTAWTAGNGTIKGNGIC